MKRLTLTLAIAGAIATVGATNVQAQSLTPSTECLGQEETRPSIVPESAFFLGLGGSFSSVHYTNQNIYFKGVSTVTNSVSGLQTGSGEAAGSVDPLIDSQFGLAPVVQAGYFRHFSGSDWLWGTKFSYSHLGTTSNKQNVLVPQAGSFSTNVTSPFTGNEEVALFQTTVTDQMSLVAFLGYSFEKSFVYLGGGPTASRNTSRLNGVVGFADILGQTVSITGTTAPENFSNSQWVAGGAAVVGVTYFFNSSWFLDVSYTLGLTATQSVSFSAPFANTPSPLISTRGTNSGTYSGSLFTQSIGISINKAF